MTPLRKMPWLSILAISVLFLVSVPAFATLPPDFRKGWEEWVKILLTTHLLGVVFWIGSLGVRLFLLGSVRPETNETVRSQLYETQRRLFRQMEMPGFLLALVAGLLLVYADIDTYQRSLFPLKMLLIAGTVVIDFIALRQFEGVRAAGKQGRAMAFSLMVVVMAAVMIFAST